VFIISFLCIQFKKNGHTCAVMFIISFYVYLCTVYVYWCCVLYVCVCIFVQLCIVFETKKKESLFVHIGMPWKRRREKDAEKVCYQQSFDEDGSNTESAFAAEEDDCKAAREGEEEGEEQEDGKEHLEVKKGRAS
jgi:hypothetical protein